MCPPGYHQNGFVATHAFGHKCMNCHKAIVVITGSGHCFVDCILYIYKLKGIELVRTRISLEILSFTKIT